MIDTAGVPRDTRTNRTDLRSGFRALADGTRRSILELLSEQPRGVGELAERFPEMSRPAVSKHLRILREAGLVRETKQGRERIYRLEAGALTRVGERASAAVPRPRQPTAAATSKPQARGAAPDRRGRSPLDKGTGRARAEPSSARQAKSERAAEKEGAGDREIGSEEPSSTLPVDWRSW
jgi:DNA-binding transcriptional ArsR family regulator